MKVPFLKLSDINHPYFETLVRQAESVVHSGKYLLGNNVALFEQQLAKYTGVSNVISTGNGFDALRLIFRAYIETGFMREGDEIIVPANTYIASILSITENKLIPVPVEPDQTLNIDINLIEQHITGKTRGIMVVHLYGRTVWCDQLTNIAKKYNLKIIEDNAQAIGASWNTKKTGNLGDAAGFSFYPTKNLGALGDAGAVATNDEQIAEIIRSLSNYGTKDKYICEYKGINSRMDEIQAAFLNSKLKDLDRINSVRRQLAQIYYDQIWSHSVFLPHCNDPSKVAQDESHVWHLFTIRTHHRDKLQNYLKSAEIETIIHYPVPPHLQLAFSEWNAMKLPITEKIHSEILSIPLNQAMKEEEILYISEILNKYEE